MTVERPGTIEVWKPMPYWEFICGSCGKGLFMEPEGDALLGRCRTFACEHKGLVVKVYPPKEPA